tara:strand:+ start:221 stop:1324 length:1104 start_codon:yes stop_codon:yes gene_type:complete
MEIIYITYQAIPSNTAHGVHTFSIIKNLARSNVNVSLVYPLRDKDSTKNTSLLQKLYGFEESFKVLPTKHFLPFGKIKYFPKFMYLFSHVAWSYIVSKTYKHRKYNNIFTLSDWVFYFLSRKRKNIVFECHNLTKLRIRLLKKSLKINSKSKVVFINELIRQDAGFEKGPQVHVLESGYDDDLFFQDSKNGDKKKIVFSGNLLRFGQDRGVKTILHYFINLKLFKSFQFHIIGGPDDYVNELKKSFQDIDNCEIYFYGHLNRVEVAKILNSAHIGILVNNSTIHSDRHTSPLKYFEYLGSGLNIVATNVESHKILPYSENINFFDLDNQNTFKEAIINASNENKKEKNFELSKLTNQYRTDKLINLF